MERKSEDVHLEIMDEEDEIDEVPSEEDLDILFDRLSDLPPVLLGRNDPCLCGSGKKYKKCCLDKDKSLPVSSGIRMESFEIKSDPLTKEEARSDHEPPSEEDAELLAELYHNLREHPELIDSEDCDYFQQLNRLRIKYSDNPTILNYIANGYARLGMRDRVKALVDETYETFPGYLFGLTAKAIMYLEDGLIEKAFAVLKGAHTLKQLYPHRNVFHTTEARAFGCFMVRYWCALENIKQAEIHLELMEKILDDDDDLLQMAQKRVKRMKGIFNFKASLSNFR